MIETLLNVHVVIFKIIKYPNKRVIVFLEGSKSKAFAYSLFKELYFPSIYNWGWVPPAKDTTSTSACVLHTKKHCFPLFWSCWSLNKKQKLVTDMAIAISTYVCVYGGDTQTAVCHCAFCFYTQVSNVYFGFICCAKPPS